MNNPHNKRNHNEIGTANEETTLPTVRELMGVLGRLTEVVEQTMGLNHAEAARQTEQLQRYNSLNNFLRRNPPSFDGTPNATVITTWKDQLGEIFKAMACTDEEKLRFAVFTLEAEAATWWRATEARFERDGSVVTWAAFGLVFDNQYLPDAVGDRLEKEFYNLFQGGTSLAACKSKFTTLLHYAKDIADNEDRKAKRLVQGLREPLGEKMAINRYETLGLAVQHATELETNLQTVAPNPAAFTKRQRDGNRDSSSGINKKRGIWGNGQNQGGQQGTPFVPLCNTCNRRHHGNCFPICSKCNHRHLGECLRVCSECSRRHSGPCLRTTNTCYNCGEAGHIQRFCTKPRKDKTREDGPQNNGQRRKATGRVFIMTEEGADAS